MERTLGKTTYRLIINSDNPQEYNSHGVIIDTINYENNILNGDGYIIEVIKMTDFNELIDFQKILKQLFMASHSF